MSIGKRYEKTAKRVDLDLIASQRKSEKPPSDKPPKEKTDTQKKIEKTESKLDDLWKELGDLTDPSTPNSGVNPKAMVVAIKLIGAYTELGYYKFKDFIEQGVQKIGKEKMLLLGPSLERAWDSFRAADTSGKMDASVSVTDTLSVDSEPDTTTPEPKEVTDSDGNEFQVPNKPRSKGQSVETLVPRNHAHAYERAMDAIESEYGDIDQFVAKELGMKVDKSFWNKFSAEQVDALALAIYQHKSGNGFIIGDQTGVGKGRFVAAMLVYAKRNGMVPGVHHRKGVPVRGHDARPDGDRCERKPVVQPAHHQRSVRRQPRPIVRQGRQRSPHVLDGSAAVGD
jgi:hypothetical protein